MSGSPLGTQICPPSPTFTEDALSSLAGKVYIITGSNSGVGLELAKILYSRNATVYIAARSADKIAAAIKAISDEFPSSTDRLEALIIDLSDVESIPTGARTFKEDRLDGLILNAGVMTPPAGSVNKHGHELQMGTNSLGAHLLEKCFEERLVETSKKEAPGSVRIVWLSSLLQVSTPKGGIQWDEQQGQPKLLKDQMENYMMSKVGNIFLAEDASRRLGQHSIVSVSVNPGLMKTELQRHSPSIMGMVMGLVFKGPKFGAYTELFALLSPELTVNNNGAFVIPWGRIGAIPDHILAAYRSKKEGGTGMLQTFLEWCDKETSAYS